MSRMLFPLQTLPLLFTLFTNDCVSHDDSVKIMTFSDDTTVKGLIKNDDEMCYREEVEKLVVWCQDNNLELNVSKTKKKVVDFQTNPPVLTPLTINNEDVEQVNSFMFLGTTISKDLKWSCHITHSVKKARQFFFKNP